MRSNKKIIIVISIVLILVIAGAIFGYLFVMTDVFKSNEKLFAEYFTQYVGIFEDLTNFKTADVFRNLKNENEYESNTTLKIVHSEGGEISNPVNDLSFKLEIQKDASGPYFYGNGKVLFADETYIEAEAIKEKDVYGIRIPEAVKEFVSVENDEKLQEISSDIGLDKTYLENAINILDENYEGLPLSSLEDKYSNIKEIIGNEILKGTFEKQRKIIIKVDDVNVQANAYSLTLDSEQVGNVLESITECFSEEIASYKQKIFGDGLSDGEISFDEESDIPKIKITVYEQNKKTIRTVIEIDEKQLVIEGSQQNGKVVVDVNYFDEENQIETQITKNTSEQQENFEIITDVLSGEENYTLNLLSEMQYTNNEITFNIEMNHKEDITKKAIKLETKVDLGNDIKRKQSFKEAGNVILNNIQQQRRKDVMEILKTAIPQTINEKIILLGEKFGIENESNDITDESELEEAEGMSQTEINKFNSKFEFYTGDEVSYENVKNLLDVVKNNISGYTTIIINPENEQENNDDQKKTINLIIEKDKTDEETITKVLEELSDNKKYKISITYKDPNGLIDYITITEV